MSRREGWLVCISIGGMGIALAGGLISNIYLGLIGLGILGVCLVLLAKEYSRR